MTKYNNADEANTKISQMRKRRAFQLQKSGYDEVENQTVSRIITYDNNRNTKIKDEMQKTGAN